MAKETTFYRDVLDILFADRNKEYGAYVIRRKYPDYVRNALGLALLFVALCVSVPVISGIISKKLAEAERHKVTDVELLAPPDLDVKTPPPPPPPPPPTPPPPPRAEIKFVPPVVKKDNEVKEEAPPPQEKDLQEDKDIGTKNVEGDNKDTGPVVEVVDVGEGDKAVVEAPAPKKEEVFEYVEQMPSFAAGDAELLKFLAKNIKYPDIARESGTEGTVVVQFVVDENGNITEAQSIKDIGGGCGKEAVRVVQTMSGMWKAGKQNGKPVKVKFKLPVRFRLD